MKTAKISELFASFQGEGNRTGWLSLWVRFFGCNFECPKFGQTTENYVSPYDNLLHIKSYDEYQIPVTGCDSSYSWNKAYKHLAQKLTREEVAEKLFELGDKHFDMDRNWTSAFSRNPVQLCFTGGEPMLQQEAMVAILEECSPTYLTIETNGSKKLKQFFLDYILDEDIALNWAISPKLESVSGEKNAIKWDILNSYAHEFGQGCLKFVVDNTQECLDEINDMRLALREFFLDNPSWRLYAMPVGATLEQQQRADMEQLVNKFMKLGFGISLRNHIYVFGNKLGS